MAQPKRATIPGNTFESKTGRVIKEMTEDLTTSADSASEMLQPETVKPESRNTVSQSNGKTGKISFYITSEQEDKLDELVFAYKKRTGTRINRNDIVRYLIDKLVLEDLDGLDTSLQSESPKAKR